MIRCKLFNITSGRCIRRMILACLIAGFANNVRAIDLTGNIFSHDPATLMKEGDTVWHFYTAPGIGATYSTNLIHWNNSSNRIFSPNNWKSSYPAWTIPYFGTSNTDGNLWAPDVIYMNGAYYLYYSCSSFGSAYSAIGVVKSPSLNNPVWTDMGKVVSSSNSTNVNAIDPGMFKDGDGKVYMVYGSWSGGIGIVDIDTVTGLATSAVTKLYGGSGLSVEAAALFKEGGYYYLVMNRGTCCNGVNSTYYMIVGRSTSVKGPYGEYRTLLANKDGKYVGPGHFSLYRDHCANYVSIHYYNANSNGFPTLDVLKMKMVDGWPILYRTFELDNCYDEVRANAGGDAVSCINVGYNLNTSAPRPSGSFYSLIEWTDMAAGGRFSDSSLLNPTYAPPSDFTGDLKLVMKAIGTDTTQMTYDTMNINVIENNVLVFAGPDQMAWEGVALDFSTLDSMPSAQNYKTLSWSDNGAGGKFSSYSIFTPVYTPKLGSAGMVTLTLSAFGENSCKSSDDVILDVAVDMDYPENHALAIYPNPSHNGTFYLNWPGPDHQGSTIRIYSLQGKLVKEYAVTDKNIYSFQLGEKGIYILKIQINNELHTKKLIYR